MNGDPNYEAGKAAGTLETRVFNLENGVKMLDKRYNILDTRMWLLLVGVLANLVVQFVLRGA